MASFIAKQVVGKKLDSVKGKQYFVGVTSYGSLSFIYFMCLYVAQFFQ